MVIFQNFLKLVKFAFSIYDCSIAQWHWHGKNLRILWLLLKLCKTNRHYKECSKLSH